MLQKRGEEKKNTWSMAIIKLKLWSMADINSSEVDCIKYRYVVYD